MAKNTGIIIVSEENIHQKIYKDTLKTNNLAQAALILNLLVVIYILIRVMILVFSFAMSRFM